MLIRWMVIIVGRNSGFNEEEFFPVSFSDDIIEDPELKKLYEMTDNFDVSEYDAAFDDDFIIESKNEYITSKSKSEVNEKNSKSKDVSHKNHRQRVREKFIKFGLEPFSEIEVLEMLLYYSIPQRDTNVLAHRLLDKFGSLHGVLDADFNELVEVNGISDVSASLIMFHTELYKYLRMNQESDVYLDTSLKVGNFCSKYFYNHTEENLILLSFDSKRKLKCVDVISKGTEVETAFYPRKIIKAIVKNKTNNVILAHNHPGGNTQPSTNDIYITDLISKMLKSIGVTVCDHIICSGQKFFSFSDAGKLI